MQRPQETLGQLSAIFPGFAEWWKDEGAPPEDGLVDGVYYEWSHHAVMSQFLDYFSCNHSSFTDKQLRAFGAWVNQATKNEGKLENAVATCFLEGMRAKKINLILAPYFRQAKRKRDA